MNIIRIVSKKKPNLKVPDIYLPLSCLQNDLTAAAKQHNNGYITSQSYFPITNNINEMGTLYNISDWKNNDYWLDWLHSDVRSRIYEQYKILDSETHIKLKARVPFNDLPLL